MISSVTSIQEFENFIKDHEFVILDFYADWCAPCKMMGQVLADLETQKALPEFVRVLKINVDTTSDLAQKFEVQALPTFVFLKNGSEVDRFVGFRPGQEIVQIVNTVFK